MTSTKPPNGPGSRRAVPEHPTPRQVELLRELVDQDKRWILRPHWDAYLAERVDLDEGTDIARLTRDQRVAARSWLRQQTHVLHARLVGGRTAPDGWLEGLPLYEALRL
jgi:hypothetical protein